MRLQPLDNAHSAIQSELKRRDAGKITSAEADRRIRNIAEFAAKKPAAVTCSGPAL